VYLTRTEAVEVMRLILLDTHGQCRTDIRSNGENMSPHRTSVRQFPPCDKLYVLVWYGENVLKYYVTSGSYQQERRQPFVLKHVYRGGKTVVVAQGTNLLLGHLSMYSIRLAPDVQEVMLSHGNGCVIDRWLASHPFC